MPRHAVAARTHRVRHAVALTLVGVLAVTTAGVAAAYTKLQGNMDVADALALAGAAPVPSGEPTEEPDPTDPQAGRAVTMLIMGSDERDGLNGEIGGTEGVEGMRSDTTIVVHISADRSRAEVVSIPRDSLVDIPSCTMTDGSTSRAQNDTMFNAAFATGWDQGGDIASAAGCTIKTVQALTGLTIDHFVVVDFAGFQGMVDAIGGVPMCIPEVYLSPDAGLHVAAGFQTLDGPTALAYARARKGTNMNGSDLERASRQQELVAAMVRQVLSKNVLTDAAGLIRFLDAATESLTVDPGLGRLTDMAGLALSLKGLDTSQIAFMTVPVATAPTDANRVVWTSAAAELWGRMAQDQAVVATAAPVTGTDPSAGTTDDTATDTATDGSTATASTPAVTVEPIPGVDAFTGEQGAAACG